MLNPYNKLQKTNFEHNYYTRSDNIMKKVQSTSSKINKCVIVSFKQRSQLWFKMVGTLGSKGLETKNIFA